MTLEANAFNVTNTPALATPIAVLNSTRFGEITNTKPGFNPRQLQLGAKVTF
jgi:hypothetical protein